MTTHSAISPQGERKLELAFDLKCSEPREVP
jgi:hypothetical protein